MEDRDTAVRRMKMRSMRRGIKEMDLILGAFAATELPGLGESLLDDYEQLLRESDHDIYRWVSSGEDAPPELQRVLTLIRKGADGVTKPK